MRSGLVPKTVGLLGALALGLVTLSGCALTDAQIALNPASNVRSRGGRGREVIVMEATDERSDKSRCGIKRNSYGVETANVYCSPAPRAWLGQLVAHGLREAGFHVVTTKTKHGADPLFVHLNLEHLFVDSMPGMWTVALVAEAHVVVKVGTVSGLSAERSFFVKGQNDTAAVLDSDIEATMDTASQRLAEAIVHAIVNLANHYPGVGAVEVAALGPGERQALLEREP